MVGLVLHSLSSSRSERRGTEEARCSVVPVLVVSLRCLCVLNVFLCLGHNSPLPSWLLTVLLLLSCSHSELFVIICLGKGCQTRRDTADALSGNCDRKRGPFSSFLLLLLFFFFSFFFVFFFAFLRSEVAPLCFLDLIRDLRYCMICTSIMQEIPRFFLDLYVCRLTTSEIATHPWLGRSVVVLVIKQLFNLPVVFYKKRLHRGRITTAS